MLPCDVYAHLTCTRARMRTILCLDLLAILLPFIFSSMFKNVVYLGSCKCLRHISLSPETQGKGFRRDNYTNVGTNHLML
jgi:hypothetical protein